MDAIVNESHFLGIIQFQTLFLFECAFSRKNRYKWVYCVDTKSVETMVKYLNGIDAEFNSSIFFLLFKSSNFISIFIKKNIWKITFFPGILFIHRSLVSMEMPFDATPFAVILLYFSKCVIFSCPLFYEHKIQLCFSYAAKKKYALLILSINKHVFNSNTVEWLNSGY